MFVSMFAVDLNSQERVFRSTFELSHSKMNFYIGEFMREDLLTEGVIEKGTYNYVYTSNGSMYYVAQTDKFTFVVDAFKVVNYLRNTSGSDMFDIIFFMDNILYEQEVLFDNVQVIMTMDSQDEKLHTLHQENKKIEMQRQAKEHKKQQLEEEMMNRYRDAMVVTPTEIEKPQKKKVVIEKSEKPLLIILKEKVNIVIDKENFIKQNHISGEMSLVISDAKYKNATFKMKNLMKNCKYSPYLDKEALKNSTLKFEKERQVDKNIPLMKWSGKSKELPISFEIWADEDNVKFISTLTFTASRNLKNLKISIPTENARDFEVEGEHDMDQSNLILFSEELKKGESETFELKYISEDVNGIFPIKVEFSDALECKVEIDEIINEGEKTDKYEFRKILEVDNFKIVGE